MLRRIQGPDIYLSGLLGEARGAPDDVTQARRLFGWEAHHLATSNHSQFDLSIFTGERKPLPIF